jgi:hypothetical protein
MMDACDRASSASAVRLFNSAAPHGCLRGCTDGPTWGPQPPFPPGKADSQSGRASEFSVCRQQIQKKSRQRPRFATCSIHSVCSWCAVFGSTAHVGLHLGARLRGLPEAPSPSCHLRKQTEYMISCAFDFQNQRMQATGAALRALFEAPNPPCHLQNQAANSSRGARTCATSTPAMP